MLPAYEHECKHDDRRNEMHHDRDQGAENATVLHEDIGREQRQKTRETDSNYSRRPSYDIIAGDLHFFSDFALIISPTGSAAE